MLKASLVKKILPLILFVLFVIGGYGCKQTQPVEKTNKATVVEWSKNLNIYEANIRQYSEEGNFAAFEKELPNLKEMGVGIIWFMPIHPIGEKERKGTLGSYYAVKDYKAVNPEFGTIEEFKNLVSKIHSMGMFVIIDWVANHTSWDHVWTETNPDFFTKDSLGNYQPPVDDWSDVIDLNYDNKEVWTAMTDAMEFWVKECNIDGYRCDVAGMVPLGFWQQVRTKLDAIKPVFMLAEAWEPELHNNAFDMTYDWNFLHIMNNVPKGEKNALDIAKHFQDEKKDYAPEDYRMLFTTNHDENSWNGTAFERLGEGAETFSVICATAKGMNLIYSGQEAGLDKPLQFFEKDPIEWKDHPHRELYTKLAELKKSNKALWNGIYGSEMILLPTSKDENVFAFARQKDGDAVIVICNLSDNKITADIENAALTGSYNEIFKNTSFILEGKLNVDLAPWAYLVLVKNNK